MNDADGQQTHNTMASACSRQGTTGDNVHDAAETTLIDGAKATSFSPPAPYRPIDVLLGRGRLLQKHTGNRRMLEIVDTFRTQYVTMNREFRKGLAEKVLDKVLEGGALFLRRTQNSKDCCFWEEVEPPIALEKISHALRCKSRASVREKVAPRIRKSPHLGKGEEADDDDHDNDNSTTGVAAPSFNDNDGHPLSSTTEELILRHHQLVQMQYQGAALMSAFVDAPGGFDSLSPHPANSGTGVVPPMHHMVQHPFYNGHAAATFYLPAAAVVAAPPTSSQLGVVAPDPSPSSSSAQQEEGAAIQQPQELGPYPNDRTTGLNDSDNTGQQQQQQRHHQDDKFMIAHRHPAGGLSGPFPPVPFGLPPPYRGGQDDLKYKEELFLSRQVYIDELFRMRGL